MKPLYDIALIGVGVAGVSLLSMLSKKVNNPLSVLAIDKVSNLGRGAVFNQDAECVLMNTPSGALSIDFDNPRDFVDWAKTNLACEYQGEYAYVPRALFGEYVHQKYSSLKNLVLTEEYGMVQSIRKKTGNWEVTTGTQTFLSKIVVLATGPLPQIDSTSPCYVSNPFPVSSKLAQINKNSKVLVIGSNLSAIDTVVSLKQFGHKGKITCASRRGRLPEVKGILSVPQPRFATFENFRRLASKNPLSLRDVLRLVRKEFLSNQLKWREVLFPKNQGADTLNSFEEKIFQAELGVPWFNVVVGIQLEVDRSWKFVKENDIKLFFQHFYHAVQLKHGAIPLVNAKKILKFMKSCDMRILGGVTKIEILDNEVIAHFADGHQERFDQAVDARGFSGSLKSNSELYSQLFEELNIKEWPFGGIRVDNNGHVLPRTPDLEGLFLLGHPTSASHPFISNLEWLVENCEYTARALALTSDC